MNYRKSRKMATALKQIPTRQLGTNGPTVSAVGLGTMGIGAYYGKTNDREAYESLTYAANRGMTFWDCADIYGDSELVLGKWFAETGRRNEIFLATKFGTFDPEGKFGGGKQISTPSYIQYALQRSLKRLGVKHIDLYYQHRVDPNVPIEIVLEALREPLEKGQIRWIGLSECSIATLKRAKAVKGVGEKLIACQMEFSPFSLHIEKSGFVEAAKEQGVAVVAYSPLARGLVTGAYKSRSDFESGDIRLLQPRFSEENFSKNLVLTDRLASIGKRLNATPSQVTLAWILAEYDYFVPIPGSRSTKRVEENAAAAELHLSTQDVKAIRELCENADIYGERTAQQFKSFFIDECISLDEWKGE